MKRTFYVLLLSLASCGLVQEEQKPDAVHLAFPELAEQDTTGPYAGVAEVFTDSLRIGEKGKSKVELVKHRVLEQNIIALRFYTKTPAGWQLRGEYEYECDTNLGLEPFIGDFNNDHRNDLTFVSAAAGRGANEIRRLFLYDDVRQQLFPVKNAEDYPNLRYNGTLNCIDAFLVYGKCTTLFARIEGDSLKTFAGVDNDEYRTAYEIDASGKQHVLSRQPIDDSDDIYIRYKNYNPVEE